MHVEHFMTKNPVACDANEPVESVARLMRDKGVGCVVVLRNGKVAGIVNDRQLAIGVLGEGLGADTPVEEVMTTDPGCVTLEDSASRRAGRRRRPAAATSNGGDGQKYDYVYRQPYVDVWALSSFARMTTSSNSCAARG